MNNYFIFFDIIIKADENYWLDPSDLVISFFWDSVTELTAKWNTALSTKSSSELIDRRQEFWAVDWTLPALWASFCFDRGETAAFQN